MTVNPTKEDILEVLSKTFGIFSVICVFMFLFVIRIIVLEFFLISTVLYVGTLFLKRYQRNQANEHATAMHENDNIQITDREF